MPWIVVWCQVAGSVSEGLVWAVGRRGVGGGFCGGFEAGRAIGVLGLTFVRAERYWAGPRARTEAESEIDDGVDGCANDHADFDDERTRWRL